jgi:ribonuclease HII
MPSKKSLPELLCLEDDHAVGYTAGVDEAGRGPLAGPVVAAAVILNPEHPIAGLNDSKKLSPRRRAQLFELICSHALGFAIAQASAQEIDTLNILQATLLAMRRAVAALPMQPARVLVDGKHLPELPMPAQAIVGGDARVAAIAAASILAKVHRDRLCLQLHHHYPAYGFDVHKGYPTAAHRMALQQHGACPAHRRSFAPVHKVLHA